MKKAANMHKDKIKKVINAMSGFTVLELAVTTAIIAVLTGALLPTIRF
jgi:prepilin-type N-terminal cleavage/methylation domain-containing protein